MVLVLTYDMTVASHNPDVVDFGIVDTSIAATHMMLQAAELGGPQLLGGASSTRLSCAAS